MRTATQHPATYNPASETREIRIGSRVRSFDYEGRDLTGDRACYVEGYVVGIGWFGHRDCQRYKIYVTGRTFGGEREKPAADENENFVFPPVNGTRRMMGGFTDGVEVI